MLLGDSPCLGRVIALAALVRASGLRLQYRFLIRRFRVGDWSFPLQLRPWRRTGQLDLEQVSSLVHPAALRSSSVAIAVALSPAAPIDRSSPSSSGVHGGPGALISSLSASCRGSDSIRVLLFSLTLRSGQAILRYYPRLLFSWPTSSTDAPRLWSIPEAVESSFPLRLQPPV